MEAEILKMECDLLASPHQNQEIGVVGSSFLRYFLTNIFSQPHAKHDGNYCGAIQTSRKSSKVLTRIQWKMVRNSEFLPPLA